MIIGIILTAYNMEDYLRPCLAPWLTARTKSLNGHTFKICAVSLPFAGFPNDGADETTNLLRAGLNADQIDHLITEPANIPETTARGMALTWLMDAGCDLSIQVDADEFFRLEDISKILWYVDANPLAPSFRLSLKNYVFDDKTYLVEPFTPMRIHRLRGRDYHALSFWADNNILYRTSEGYDVRDDQMAVMTVPAQVAWVKHVTWLSDDRSRRKVAYHENHFNSRPSGVRSSYRWDDIRGLVFNEAYYRYVGQPVPRTARDE